MQLTGYYTECSKRIIAVIINIPKLTWNALYKLMAADCMWASPLHLITIIIYFAQQKHKTHKIDLQNKNKISLLGITFLNIMKNEKRKVEWNSGGILVFYRNIFHDHITVDTSNESIFGLISKETNLISKTIFYWRLHFQGVMLYIIPISLYFLYYHNICLKKSCIFVLIVNSYILRNYTNDPILRCFLHALPQLYRFN